MAATCVIAYSVPCAVESATSHITNSRAPNEIAPAARTVSRGPGTLPQEPVAKSTAARTVSPRTATQPQGPIKIPLRLRRRAVVKSEPRRFIPHSRESRVAPIVAPSVPAQSSTDLFSNIALSESSSFAGYRVVEVAETDNRHVRVEIDLPGYSENQMNEDLAASDANSIEGRVLYVECSKRSPFVHITVQPRHIVYPAELGLVEASAPGTSVITIDKPVDDKQLHCCYQNGSVVLTFPLTSPTSVECEGVEGTLAKVFDDRTCESLR